MTITILNRDSVVLLSVGDTSETRRPPVVLSSSTAGRAGVATAGVGAFWSKRPGCQGSLGRPMEAVACCVVEFYWSQMRSGALATPIGRGCCQNGGIYPRAFASIFIF